MDQDIDSDGVAPIRKYNYKSRAYMDNLWIIDGNTATYNGYHKFNVEEFTFLLESFDMNATKVRKHYYKHGRKLPVDIIYSLRRFLNLPEFKFKGSSCYNAS
jgi:hypothetical protein